MQPPRKIIIKRPTTQEDRPVAFGYKIAWIAVRSSNAHAVAKVLKLGNVNSSSWWDGIKFAYNREGVFVSPVIDGWTLAVGKIPDAGQVLPLLEELSRQFGKAYYFGTHRVVGYQAWVAADFGKVTRAFAYLGERGEVLLNVGKVTAEEKEIGTGADDPDAAPNEETVLELASKWVLDPRDLDEKGPCGPGLFGLAAQ